MLIPHGNLSDVQLQSAAAGTLVLNSARGTRPPALVCGQNADLLMSFRPIDDGGFITQPRSDNGAWLTAGAPIILVDYKSIVDMHDSDLTVGMLCLSGGDFAFTAISSRMLALVRLDGKIVTLPAFGDMIVFSRWKLGVAGSDKEFVELIDQK